MLVLRDVVKDLHESNLVSVRKVLNEFEERLFFLVSFVVVFVLLD
jgi:hypothetical protein